jgi:hypothetical protein
VDRTLTAFDSHPAQLANPPLPARSDFNFGHSRGGGFFHNFRTLHDPAGDTIAAAISSLSALTDLALLRCYVTTSAAALASALPALSRLSRLSLRGSSLGTPGCAEVCAAAGRLAELRDLDLSGGAVESAIGWDGTADDAAAEAAAREAVAAAFAGLSPLTGLIVLRLG